MPHPYCTREFAESLPHIGQASHVPAWGTYALIRDINNSNHKDICGIYPITRLGDQINFQAGIDQLRNDGFVSITLVITPDQLSKIPSNLVDHLKPFKQHYIAKSGIRAYTRYHRRYVTKANKQVRTEILDLAVHLNDWINIYDHTADRNHFSAMHRFLRSHHETLATLNGITAIGAWLDDQLVSAHIWACDDRSAHSHLVASNDLGYKTNAAYAVNDFSLNHFRNMDIINFGGSAGLDGQLDGLARFKSGFCNDVAQSYIVGIILDQKKYKDLSPAQTTFFPAYRDPFLKQEVLHEHTR